MSALLINHQMDGSEVFTDKCGRGKQINAISSRAEFSQGHSNMIKSYIAPRQREGNEDKVLTFKFNYGAKSSYRLHVQLTYFQN